MTMEALWASVYSNFTTYLKDMTRLELANRSNKLFTTSHRAGKQTRTVILSWRANALPLCYACD